MFWQVNHSPSFTTDSPLDREVKDALLCDTINLINVHACNKRKVLEEDKQRAKERLLQGHQTVRASRYCSSPQCCTSPVRKDGAWQSGIKPRLAVSKLELPEAVALYSLWEELSQAICILQGRARARLLLLGDLRRLVLWALYRVTPIELCLACHVCQCRRAVPASVGSQ